MSETKPEDDLLSDNWGHGKKSPAGSASMSQKMTTTGARTLQRSLWGKLKFRQDHLDQIARTMAELDKNELEATRFMQAASYDLMLRFLASVDDEELPSVNLTSQLNTCTRLYVTWTERYEKLLSERENILDYDVIMGQDGD